MTEAAIITLTIVGGVIAAFWLVVHYAFAAWKAERIMSASTEAVGDVNIYQSSNFDSDVAANMARHDRLFGPK